MSAAVSVEAIYRAQCNDCDWTLERSMDDGDLPAEENEQIVERVARNHEYTCPSIPDRVDWGDQTADVTVQGNSDV